MSCAVTIGVVFEGPLPDSPVFALGGTGVGGAGVGEAAVCREPLGETAVGGTGVGGAGVGEAAVFRTPVGETAVGGTGVGGTGVGEAVGALGASSTGVGCLCAPEGSSTIVGPHPIAIIVINTRTISFMVLRPLCSLAPANAGQCLRLAYYKVLPSNYLSSMSVPLGAV